MLILEFMSIFVIILDSRHTHTHTHTHRFHSPEQAQHWLLSEASCVGGRWAGLPRRGKRGGEEEGNRVGEKGNKEERKGRGKREKKERIKLQREVLC